MANQLYGYNSTSYRGGGSNLSSSRSIADQYLSGEPSFLGSSSRYYGSDPLSSSSTTVNRGTSLLSNHAAVSSYSAAAGIDGGGPLTMAMSQASWPGPPGVDAGTSAASIDPLFMGLKRSSQALYHQTVFGAHYTIGQSEAWFSTNPVFKRPRYETASSLPIYPQRQGEKDCAHYMLTRTCKFGESCKFDHPIWVPEGGIPDWKELQVPLDAGSESLPERPGEPDCPYFLKTQRCKFGPRCKFNHPKDKIAPLCVSENAETILPDRPSEPPCAFYLKTGICKFGSTCKFHHPIDIPIPSDSQQNGIVGQTEAVMVGDLNLAKNIFSPALLHNSKGLPIRPEELNCPFYVKTGSCKYGATCRYNHPDIFTINPSAGIGPALVASPASSLNIGVVNPPASVLQTIDPRLTQPTFGSGPTFYPQRPGQMECDFYMKTGECKFGEICRFHHPIDRAAHTLLSKEAKQQEVKLTLAGLPRREGAINCPYYMKTGACKYGATCKFDHPPPGEVLAFLTLQGISTTNGVGNDDKKVAETTED